MNTNACSSGIIIQSHSYAAGDLVNSQRWTVNALRHIHISVTDSPVYIKFGDSNVVATKGSDNEMLIPVDWVQCFQTNPVQTDVAVIELRPSAAVSIAELG